VEERGTCQSCSQNGRYKELETHVRFHIDAVLDILPPEVDLSVGDLAAKRKLKKYLPSLSPTYHA
jgi:hypothetical protein